MQSFSMLHGHSKNVAALVTEPLKNILLLEDPTRTQQHFEESEEHRSCYFWAKIVQTLLLTQWDIVCVGPKLQDFSQNVAHYYEYHYTLYVAFFFFSIANVGFCRRTEQLYLKNGRILFSPLPFAVSRILSCFCHDKSIILSLSGIGQKDCCLEIIAELYLAVQDMCLESRRIVEMLLVQSLS